MIDHGRSLETEGAQLRHVADELDEDPHTLGRRLRSLAGSERTRLRARPVRRQLDVRAAAARAGPQARVKLAHLPAPRTAAQPWLRRAGLSPRRSGGMSAGARFGPVTAASRLSATSSK